jgi:hypothetical protein
MVYPPPGFACTTSREGSKDADRFQALYRPEHAVPLTKVFSEALAS